MSLFSDSRLPAAGPASDLRVEVIRDFDRLAAIADSWNELVFSTGQSPFLSSAWVSSYLEFRLPDGIPWSCFAAFDGSRLVGVLPLTLRTVKVAGQSRPLLTPPRDPHMPVTGMVSVPGRELAVVEAIVTSVTQAVPDLLTLEVLQVPHGSALVEWRPARAAGRTLLRHTAGVGSYLPTVRRFDDLYESLSRSVRRRLRKDRKRLEELPSIAFEVLTGPEADPSYLDRFAAVEAAGWKGRGGSAIGASESLMQFYRALVQRLYRLGSLEWHFLKTGDRTIAGHLAIRTQHTLVLWKIGYDEEFAQYSPGVTLFEYAVRNACERADIDGLDLVSNKEWHDNWPVDKRPYLDVWLYPHRMLPLIFGVLPKKARWTLRRIPGLQSLVRRVRSGGGEH